MIERTITRRRIPNKSARQLPRKQSSLKTITQLAKKHPPEAFILVGDANTYYRGSTIHRFLPIKSRVNPFQKDKKITSNIIENHQNGKIVIELGDSENQEQLKELDENNQEKDQEDQFFNNIPAEFQMRETIATIPILSSLPKFNVDRRFYTPSFILPCEPIHKESAERNHKIKLREVEKQKESNFENSYSLAKPKNNKYCGVCKIHYEQYEKHIHQQYHVNNLHKSSFNILINKICDSFGNSKPNMYCQPKANLIQIDPNHKMYNSSNSEDTDSQNQSAKLKAIHHQKSSKTIRKINAPEEKKRKSRSKKKNKKDIKFYPPRKKFKNPTKKQKKQRQKINRVLLKAQYKSQEKNNEEPIEEEIKDDTDKVKKEKKIKKVNKQKKEKKEKAGKTSKKSDVKQKKGDAKQKCDMKQRMKSEDEHEEIEISISD